MTMRKLFGTDGIRAVAGQYPLDRPTVFAIGAALAHHITPECSGKIGNEGDKLRVLLGMDTRESSAWLAATLTAGLRSAGADAVSAGVVPTPAIAHLTRTNGFCAGVVISASHNPWQDNGIKIFGPDGYKLADKTELEVEEEIFAHAANANGENAAAELKTETALDDAYIAWLAGFSKGVDFSRLNVVVDCANGAAYQVAQQLFAKLSIRSE